MAAETQLNYTSKKASKTYSKTYSKMAASVLPTPSVLPQGFTTDYVPAAAPLVRSINELRWWGAALCLDENTDITSVEASHRHQEWTWRLERTPEKFVYIQNTYFNGELVLSTKMNTNIEGRAEFIAQFFPTYKQKND